MRKTSLLLPFLAGFLALGTTLFAQPISNVIIGDMSSTADHYTVPINTYYGHSYVQQLYMASDINKPLGGTITTISFYWTGGTSGLSNSDQWTIYLGHTSKTSFTGATDWVPYVNLTEVFSGTITAPSTDQWIDITLVTPFSYNGTDNLVLGAWENVSAYATSSSTFLTTDTASEYMSISVYSDPNTVDPTAPPTSSPPSSTYTGSYTYYSNVTFGFEVEPDNTGVDSIYVTASPFCSGNNEVFARVHNYGSNIVNNVNINWSIDGVMQPQIVYNTSIDMENTTAGPEAIVSLGTVNFPYNTTTEIKAWTSEPNGQPDPKNENDTSTQSLMANTENVYVNITPGDTFFCAGNQVILDAGTQPVGAIYIWSTGAITQTVSVDEVGPVWVKVQSLGGCKNSDTVVITELPQPAASDLGVVNNSGNNFTFSIIGEQNIDSYIWDFGDGSTDTGAGPKDHTYTQPGLYAATATVSNECNTIYLTKQIQIDPTGISNIAELQNAIRLYPNPAKDKVSISVDGDVALQQISLFNLLGQKVYFSKVSGSVVEINTAALPSGLYQIVMDTDKGQAVKKLEIRK